MDYDIGERLPILSKEEQVELVLKWQTDDDWDARDKLIIHTMPFVLSQAIKMGFDDTERDDLVGAATSGMIEAIDKFDPERSDNFLVCASLWIRHYMQEHTRLSRDVIVLPRRSLFLRTKVIQYTLEGMSPREIAATIPSRLTFVLGILASVSARNSQRYKGDDKYAGRTNVFDLYIPNDLSYAKVTEQDESSRHFLTSMENLLGETQLAVMKLRYGIGYDKSYTLKETGKKLGFTSQWIEKVQIKAHARLVEMVGSDKTEWLIDKH